MNQDDALELAIKIGDYCRKMQPKKGVSATTIANLMNGRPDYADVTPREREAARSAMVSLRGHGLGEITGLGRGGWTSGTRLVLS